jgi:hypothetical protein
MGQGSPLIFSSLLLTRSKFAPESSLRLETLATLINFKRIGELPPL